MKLKKLNSFKVKVPSKSLNEGFLRATATAFSAQLDPTVDEISDIKTAISEAVTNCIVHAYKDTIGTITLTGEILTDNVLRFKIRDEGCGIQDVNLAMQPLYTTGDVEERAGLGFAVMQSFMDKVKVRSKLGRGTTVLMEKKITSKE
jgi:stage II sporulation protein AB (anti-sigma F factor)